MSTTNQSLVYRSVKVKGEGRWVDEGSFNTLYYFEK